MHVSTVVVAEELCFCLICFGGLSYFVIECMGFHVFAVLIINIFQS